MPVQADDITKGDWLVVSGTRYETPSWEYPQRQLTGRPFRVLAVSLPFISVQSGHRLYTIDVRDVILTRVSVDYARSLLEPRNEQVFKQRKRKSPPRKPEDGECPRCGDKLAQRFVNDDSSWHFFCRECGYDGGQAGAGVPRS